MGVWEWPLILFTILGETAIGIILVLWWLNSEPISSELFKKATFISGVLLALAMVFSLFHLGHPEAAYRSLAHLGSSWLSREILLFILSFVAWAYLFWQSRMSNGNISLALGITSVLGVLGIISSSMIYVLPRVPAWNNAATVFFFLLTAGLLGPLTILALGAKKLQPAQRIGLIRWALGCVVASILVFTLYITFLENNVQGVLTVQTLMTSPLFWVRSIAGWVLPLILLLQMLRSRNTSNLSLAILLVVLVGAGELLGRGLFYLSAVGIHITALF